MEHRLSISSRSFSGKETYSSIEGERFNFLLVIAKERRPLDDKSRLFDTNPLLDGIGENSDSLPPRNYPDCPPRGATLGGIYLPHNLVIIYSSAERVRGFCAVMNSTRWDSPTAWSNGVF